MVSEKSIANLRPFSSEKQPTKRTPRGPSIVTPLKKFLTKKITYEDPDTKKMTKGRIADVIALRLILNATQGENEAIKEILNRVDGKEPETEINIYTQLWQGACGKSEKVDNSGRLTNA